MAKVSKAELYRNVARAIDCDQMNLLPMFPSRYYAVEGSPGVRLYLRETEENVVEYVHENCIANEILAWINTEVIGRHGDYNFDFKNATDCARVWRAMTSPVTVKSVSWPGESGLTFRRLPWDLSVGVHPTFDEMMGRISNSRALMAFIGSLLVEDSDMQQYIWLHGQGQNGKGALSRFLHRVMGNAYSSQIPPLSGDKFWTSMILGKRLVVFPDCNNQGFVTSGLFKSLTGGDPVRVEAKQQPAMTAVMNAKYLFISNERPNLSSEKADLRRVIYCEMTAIDCVPDPGYQGKLWSEGGAFLASCLAAYHEMCPSHEQIAGDPGDNSLNDWVSSVEEEFEMLFEQNFTISERDHVKPTAFMDRLREVCQKDSRKIAEFKMWMERKYGIRKRTANDLLGTPKTYKGCLLVPYGAQIRDSQQQQYDLQRKWDKERTIKGRTQGHLKAVEPQVKDGKDGKDI